MSEQRESAKQDVFAEMRELSAILLRTIRGAGKPFEIEHRVMKLATALCEFRKLNDGYGIPSDEISYALRFRDDGDMSEAEYARDTMIRGALQIVASRMIGQRTQEAAGKSEMMSGVRSWNHRRAKG